MVVTCGIFEFFTTNMEIRTITPGSPTNKDITKVQGGLICTGASFKNRHPPTEYMYAFSRARTAQAKF